MQHSRSAACAVRAPASWRIIRNFHALEALTVAASLASCAQSVHDMGEDHDDPRLGQVPAHSRCASSLTLDGDVIVENQQQLSELEGCQAIQGSLTVVPFEGADLRPLHALQSVGGTLAFSAPGPDGGWVMREGDGCYASCPEGEDNRRWTPAAERTTQGWLESLAGLESLETAGGLRIMGYRGSHLEPLSRLRELTDSGYLRVGSCDNLVDLSGLRNVRGIRDLDVDCSNLPSLAGLPFPRELRTLRISGAKLEDLGSFGVRRIDRFFELTGTALRNLDALASLESVAQRLFVLDNPELGDMSGLNNVVNLGGLSVHGAGKLERFPALTALVQLRGLYVRDNPVLKDMDLLRDAHYGGYAEGSHLAQDPHLAHLPESIEIENNPELVAFAVPIPWRECRWVIIGRNPKLTRIDLGIMHRVNYLWISANTSLQDFSVQEQLTVFDLQAGNNGPLALTAFDGVRSLDRQLR